MGAGGGRRVGSVCGTGNIGTVEGPLVGESSPGVRIEHNRAALTESRWTSGGDAS